MSEVFSKSSFNIGSSPKAVRKVASGKFKRQFALSNLVSRSISMNKERVISPDSAYNSDNSPVSPAPIVGVKNASPLQYPVHREILSSTEEPTYGISATLGIKPPQDHIYDGLPEQATLPTEVMNSSQHKNDTVENNPSDSSMCVNTVTESDEWPEPPPPICEDELYDVPLGDDCSSQGTEFHPRQVSPNVSHSPPTRAVNHSSISQTIEISEEDRLIGIGNGLVLVANVNGLRLRPSGGPSYISREEFAERRNLSHVMNPNNIQVTQQLPPFTLHGQVDDQEEDPMIQNERPRKSSFPHDPTIGERLRYSYKRAKRWVNRSVCGRYDDWADWD